MHVSVSNQIPSTSRLSRNDDAVHFRHNEHCRKCTCAEQVENLVSDHPNTGNARLNGKHLATITNIVHKIFELNSKLLRT